MQTKEQIKEKVLDYISETDMRMKRNLDILLSNKQVVLTLANCDNSAKIIMLALLKEELSLWKPMEDVKTENELVDKIFKLI